MKLVKIKIEELTGESFKPEEDLQIINLNEEFDLSIKLVL